MSEQQHNPGPVQMQIQLVPELQAAPYHKADVFQACRIDHTFALSCYQMDYQALAILNLKPDGSSPSGPSPARLVSRIAMDEESFRRLRDEVNRIAELVGLK
jgi:hypothetical protein